MSAEELALAVAPLVEELELVKRYARRAWSRRKFAIRDFARARSQTVGGLAALRRLRTGPILRRPATGTAVEALIAQAEANLHDFKVRSASALGQYRAALEKYEAALVAEAERAAARELTNEEKVRCLLIQIGDLPPDA